ncbi:MAG: hypothetical protein V4485_04645, partial [Pseudomonadota bacterium]
MPQESVSSSPSKSTSHVQTYLPSELLKQAALDAQNSYDIYDGSISTEGTGDELFLMTNHLLDGPQRGGQFRCAV